MLINHNNRNYYVLKSSDSPQMGGCLQQLDTRSQTNRSGASTQHARFLDGLLFDSYITKFEYNDE